MEEQLSALEKAISMAESGIEATSLDGYQSRMIAATAYASIAQAELTKRLADAYEALLKFNIENMELGRKQSAELSAKIGGLMDTLAGLGDE